jgi:hypothetical protein
VIAFGTAHEQLCGVTLDPEHPDTDGEHGVIVSSGGWVVGYDGSVGS